MPEDLWNTFSSELSKDFIVRHSGNDATGKNEALQSIARLLEEHGRGLSEFGLPEPISNSREVAHELERWSMHTEMFQGQADAGEALFNEEQRAIYERVMNAISANKPLLAFIDGKAGRGKTTVVRVLCDRLRSLGKIVIATASSAFAAQLYSGGRTTHSAFKVPVNEKSELLQSSIKRKDPRGELLEQASLIIWDEAPMANRTVLQCVDEVCRTVMASDGFFGNKVVLLLGDFRQTCPVVRRGSRAQVIDASIKSSPLWHQFQILRLIQPIRNAEDPEFADFVDEIGDGAGPNVSLHLLQQVHTEGDLINFVYPSSVISDPYACLSRAILAPTNAQIDAINSTILDKLEGGGRLFLAADSLKEAGEAGVAAPHAILDYVATNTPPGLPHFNLNIKIGGIYRLLRNFSIDKGLVKNVRVMVIDIGARIVTVRLLQPGSSSGGEDFLIPRIPFHHELSNGHTLIRRQFPLAPAYATTFNSCQGLTLDVVGVILTRDVFSHGQLYTALSRIRHRSHARVLLRPGESTVKNVTYEEILI